MAIIPNLSPLNRADVRQNVVANTGLETVKASAHPSTLEIHYIHHIVHNKDLLQRRPAHI